MIGALPQLAGADEEAEKKGAALMDKYVEVTGGKAAYEAIKSRIVKGQQTLPGGVTGKFELYSVYPDKFRSIVGLPVGTLERGSDGKTVWVSFPAGATILEGAAASRWLFVIAPKTGLADGEVFFRRPSISVTKMWTALNAPKVALTLKPIDPKVEESPVTMFIAQDSGLIVKWTAKLTGEWSGPQGNLEVTIHLSDYRKIGDVSIPYQMKAAFKDNEISVKIEEIVFNTEIPPDKFALPEAVKEQLKNSKKDDKEKDGKEKK